jgi:transaldolase
LPAIEEAIFAGVPVNVTLLFSREHYLAAAAAYLRGIQRRIEAGLNPWVESVASVFVSRWDGAGPGKTPEEFHNRLGIAMAERTYKAHRDLLNSDRWMRLAKSGVHPQRLLWTSTGTKDPQAPDYLYVKALAAPNTVNTMPETTLLKFGEHGELGRILSSGGGESDEFVYTLQRLGIDMDALATQLQKEGTESSVKSWDEMMDVVAKKAQALK